MTTRLTQFRTLALAAAIITSIGTPGMGAQAGQPDKPPKAVAIEIDNFTFGVVSIEVAAGTTVKWTNRDDVPHTVVSSTKLFKSPPLDTGEAFSYTFKEPGTFEYYCSMHPRMTGKIVVR
jgi:plastocyanin